MTAVDSSNFGATGVSGSVVVGPLDATTDYTITCSGPNGPATAHATVVVGSGDVSSIPSGVVLYSVQSPSGSSTIYYRALSGGDAVSVGTYASGVTVLGVDPAGSRLVLSAPVNGDATKLGVFLTDLDGVSHSVRMGTDTYVSVKDATIGSASSVFVATGDKGALSFTTAGVRVAYSGVGLPVSGHQDATGTHCVIADDDEIWTGTFPSFSNERIRGGGAYTWIRWSPAEPKLVFTDGSDIWTMDTAGANATKVVLNGSYPTFDSTGTRVLFSRVGDGIYVKDLNSGTESRFASVSGTWNGRIFWH